jgi:hypothetical protein
MTKGDTVHVFAAAGQVLARVEATSVPAILPEIPGAPDPRTVAAILEEWDIVELAWLSHGHAQQRLMFVALRDRAGIWRDLAGQVLTIKTVVEAQPETSHRTRRPKPD